MSGQLTKCPGCGLYVASKGDFCPYCGSRLDPNVVVCPNCLKENPKGSKVCSSCGAYLNPSYPGQDLHEGAGRQKKERKRRLSQSQKREQRAEERAGRKQTRTRRSEDQDAGREEERRKTQDREEQKKRTRMEQQFSELLEEYLRMRQGKERQSGTDAERGNRQIYSEGKEAGTGTAQGRKWNPYKAVIIFIIILCLIKPIANIVKTVMRNDTSETDSADTGGTESSSAGWRSFYRNAEIIETDDGSYSLVEADSSEIDFEDLEDWYSNYVAGTDADWFVILYTDQENSGVYAVDGLVQTGVTLEESSEGVYTLLWTEDDTMYVSSYDYTSGDISLLEVEEAGEGAEGSYDSVTWEMSVALCDALDWLDSGNYSRSKLIYYLQEVDGCSEEEAEYGADNCGADWDAMALQEAEDIMLSENHAYSRDYLIDILADNYEYTEEEAEYGADNCGVDWNETAVLAAEEMLGYGYGYSRSELIESLIDGEFTEEEAEYGADNCGADWNEQALLAAEDRLESNSGYSYTYLVERLTEGDGFTEQEAAYGADNCGADWNEQAVMAAEDYLDIDSIDWDREKLIRWLTEYDYFTETQAEYAADQVGL